MSWLQSKEPECHEREADVIDLVIESRARDLGGFSVRRVLPAAARRLVGPFIFFDEMGPAEFSPGSGLDVRPHPHIHLATVTYLFEGEVYHRDSLGSAQVIRPGAVNWMHAGRGIVHSERTPEELREQGFRLHGLQLWVALPKAAEESEPSFTHYPAEALPSVEVAGARIRVLAGSAFGVTSPVATRSRSLYVDVQLQAGAQVTVPAERERAVYVVSGSVACGKESIGAGRLIVLRAEPRVVLRAADDARLVIIGGDPMDGPRHMYWNFVSSSSERIDAAKDAWRERRFPLIPSDDVEFIPLPSDVKGTS